MKAGGRSKRRNFTPPDPLRGTRYAWQWSLGREKTYTSVARELLVAPHVQMGAVLRYGL